MTTLADLPTPALVLDRARVAANAARMRAHLDELGVALRPHVKTAKSVDVVRLALGAERGPITVSTLGEAEHFAAAGFDDLTYAVCMTPSRFPRAAALAQRGVILRLITDDARLAGELGDLAHARGLTLDVLVEVDVGEHRTGVDPDGPALLAVARRLHEHPGTRLVGVLSHGGHAYGCTTGAEVARVAEQERSATVRAARRLTDAGLPCPVVSTGSTPTAVAARSGAGVTEMRPGVYLLGDLFQAALGSCAVDDIAATVLATVISCRPDEGRLVLDAGALALSKDVSAQALDPAAGYGRLVALDGEPLGDLRVADVHQEHGEVRGAAGLLARLPAGSRVRVLPNHSCITAAAYDRFHVVEGPDDAVRATWPRVTGW